MQTVSTIGLDIAKSVFQVHGVDADGLVVVRRQLKRRYVLAFFEKLAPCLVGIEACASSHYWSRELRALGGSSRMLPPRSRAKRNFVAAWKFNDLRLGSLRHKSLEVRIDHSVLFGNYCVARLLFPSRNRGLHVKCFS